MAILEFFYDVGSPYSYLASTRVEAIAADCGATVAWRPMLLGGVFKATENTPPAFNPTRARYLAVDLQRWARYYGVPMAMRFPPANTLLPMRAITAAPVERRPELSLALFRAWWVDERDYNDPAVLAGIVGPELVARTQDQSVKDELKATTEEAIRRGAFGAPTMFVGDEMFFGNDRLPFVEQALRAAK